MAGETIVGQGADLVLLQECEAALFEPEWNSAAANILKKYDVFPCCQGNKPGTAVLVKKGGCAVPQADTPICVGGTVETGGL